MRILFLLLLFTSNAFSFDYLNPPVTLPSFPVPEPIPEPISERFYSTFTRGVEGNSNLRPLESQISACMQSCEVYTENRESNGDPSVPYLFDSISADALECIGRGALGNLVTCGILREVCPLGYASYQFNSFPNGFTGYSRVNSTIFWFDEELKPDNSAITLFVTAYQDERICIDPLDIPERNREKSLGLPEYCPRGNPVNQITGNKYQLEIDYVGAGIHPLRFERHYNSETLVTSERIGKNWRTNLDRSLQVDGTTAKLFRPDGKVFVFQQIGNDWSPDPDVTFQLNADPISGWMVIGPDDVIEKYSVDGKLLTITNRNGLSQQLDYSLSNTDSGDDDPDTLDRITDAFGRTLTFSYNADNNIASMTDPEGNVYKYNYDGIGNLESVIFPDETINDDSDNTMRIYHYGIIQWPHSLTGITDENGNRFATWIYDGSNRVISSEHAGAVEKIEFMYGDDGTRTVTDSFGGTQTYSYSTIHGTIKIDEIINGPCPECGTGDQARTYDANGFIASTTDFNGNLTTFINNSRRLQTSRTEAVGTVEERTITTEWHPVFRLPTKITESGKEILFIYDSTGRLLSKTETDTATLKERKTTNTYNAQGLIATIDGPRTDVNDITTFEYDVQGNLIKTTNALSQETNITSHDAHGRPLTIVDANNTTTILSYDARGRLLTQTVDNQTTTFDYDAVGNITKTTLPNGSFLINEYDAAQRLTAVEDNLGNRIEYTLDNLGNRTKEDIKDSQGTLTRTLSRFYNGLNRLVELIGGENQVTEFSYDANGNQTDIAVDSLGLNQKTTQTFDSLNRLTQTLAPIVFVEICEFGECFEEEMQPETRFAYDDRNNLISVTDPEGLATNYTYDGLDNLTQQQSPDTGITTFTYDDAGNRLTQTDARGVVSTFAYDALNRLVSITYPDTTQNVTFTYDICVSGVGRLCEMQDESGTTTYAYDARGNLTSQITTIDNITTTIAYAYNGADQLIQVTYPSGRTVDYLRNALGQIDSVTTTKDTAFEILADGLAYQPFGPLSALTYGNALIHSRDYDLDYRLTSLTTSNATQDLTYMLNGANNITTINNNLDINRDQSLTYDLNNRLTDAIGAYGDIDYKYDLIGNRLNEIVDNHTETYTYDTDSHHLQQTVNGGTRTFIYDANGNTISNSNRDFVYGDNNRLKEVHLLGAPMASYTYNGRGERVKKAATETIYYYYDQTGLLLAELDDTGTTQVEYIYLDGQPLALTTIASGGSVGGTITETLFSEDFSGNDGDIIDDQANNQWRGKQPRETTTSATIQSNQAEIIAEQRISTEATFIDEGDSRLSIELDLIGPGKTTLKKVNTPKTGVRVRFKPSKNKAVVKVGVFDNPVDKTEIDLSASPTQTLHVEIMLENGIANVMLTDEFGTQYSVGPIDHAALNTGDEYRLKLQTIKVDGSKVNAMADNVLVRRESEDTSPPTGLGGTFFYHTNHLGTPQKITDSTQSVDWEATYTPFGEATILTETITNNLRFPGQLSDAETGLHYNWFRYYAPSIGRYITSDRIGLDGGANTYGYVDQNPIVYFDPNGLRKIGKPGVPDSSGPNRPKATIGVFGCLVGCASFQEDDSGPQASIEPTIGGGITICQSPVDQNNMECTQDFEPINDDRTCGIYDPNCDNEEKGLLSTPGKLGFILSITRNRDGTLCINFGPHTGAPLGLGLDLGSFDER